MDITSLSDKVWDDTCQKVICSGLRDKLYLPMALNLLNFKINCVDKIPGGHPACVVYQLNAIFISKTSRLVTDYVKRNGSLEEYLAFVLFHEDLHPQLMHGERQKHRDQELWNISCDFFINGLLRQIQNEGSSGTRIVKMNVDRVEGIMIDKSFDTMIEEEIYDFLQKNGHFQKTTQFMSMGDFLESLADSMSGDKSDDDSDDSSGGKTPDLKDDPEDIEGPPVEMTITKFDYNGKKFEHRDIKIPQPDPSQMTEEEKQKYNEMKKASQMSNKMLEQTLIKGATSATLKKLLSKLFKVKIDWEKILKDSLLTAFEKSDEATWGIPEICWLANPYGMPYLPSEKDEEVRGMAVFAIDESGSMSDDDVKKAFSIVLESWEHYKGLYVIKHDSEITWQIKYDEKPDGDQINQLVTRRSYGGTSHKDVFKKVQDIVKEDENAVSVFIAVTDLCSDIESTQDLLAHNIPRVWIANSDFQVANICGRVIRLK